MLLDGLVREFGGGEQTHRLQRQVSQVRFPVAQELAQLVAGSHQQVGLRVVVNDQAAKHKNLEINQSDETKL